MSELIARHDNRATIRWKLLTGASALALTAYVTSAAAAKADDADRPLVWIELGGQLEQVEGGVERFKPPFVSMFDLAEFTSPLEIQRLPRYSVGGDVKLTFAPQDSNWVFAASLRFGRSNRKAVTHHELGYETAIKYANIFGRYTKVISALAQKFDDSTFAAKESHTILDFQAGKDVGLGIFGNSVSTVSAGIRIAQFRSSTSTTIGGDPDFGFSYKYLTQLFGHPGVIKIPKQHWHLFGANANLTHSFQGIGPSFEWDTSTPLAGSPSSLQVNLDWGINGAVLFGKQKAKGHHETRADYRPTHFHTSFDVTALTPVYRHAYPVDRSRTVVVPNIGGFAGLSFNYSNAKIKFGYRADMFFNAIDGGIDTRKNENHGFFGPYASISVGVGD